jgi:hypothetical protein
VLDRLNAWRLALAAMDDLGGAFDANDERASMIGIVRGLPKVTPVSQFGAMVDMMARRPLQQWWMDVLHSDFQLTSSHQ